MKHTTKYIVTGIAMALLLSACSDTETLQKNQLNYLPLKKGQFQVYQVKDTIYEVLEGMSVLDYQLMTEVVDSFYTVGSSAYTYVLYRSIRRTASDAWEYLDTWSVRPEKTKIVVNEGAVPFVKLSFPVVEGQVWNGNAYNDQEEEIYTIRAADSTVTVNGFTFSGAVDVLQRDNNDVIVSTDKRREIYAYGVGLIVKEVKQLYYSTEQDYLGQEKIERGIVSVQKIIDYGVH